MSKLIFFGNNALVYNALNLNRCLSKYLFKLRRFFRGVHFIVIGRESCEVFMAWNGYEKICAVIIGFNDCRVIAIES